MFAGVFAGVRSGLASGRLNKPERFSRSSALEFHLAIKQVFFVLAKAVRAPSDGVKAGPPGASPRRSVWVALTRRLWTLSAVLFLSSQMTAFQTGHRRPQRRR